MVVARVYAGPMPHEFDVQRQSPYTPEGQIEQAGHLTRGIVGRVGRDRIGQMLLAGAILFAALAVLAIVT